MLLFAALSPVMALGTYIEDRRSGRRGFADSSRDYRKRLARAPGRAGARTRPGAPRAAARPRRRRLSSSGARSGARRRSGSAAPTTPDFLSVRLGTADQPAHLSVRLDPGGQRAAAARGGGPRGLVRDRAGGARRRAARRARGARPLRRARARRRARALARRAGGGAPLAARSRRRRGGRAGPARGVGVAEVAAAHARRRRPVAVAARRRRRTRAGARRVGRRARPASARGSAEDRYGGAGQRPTPAVLLVLDETVAPGAAARRGRRSAAPRRRAIAVVWVGRERRDLPGECRGIVELDAERFRLSYTDARHGAARSTTSRRGALGRARAQARARARTRPRHELGRRGRGDPRARDARSSCSDVAEPDARLDREPLARAARRARKAPVGAAAREPFEVDLQARRPARARRRDRPAPGKSELLQTLIASLAATYPPTRLTFLLVDYKGGAAFKDCVAPAAHGRLRHRPRRPPRSTRARLAERGAAPARADPRRGRREGPARARGARPGARARRASRS